MFVILNVDFNQTKLKHYKTKLNNNKTRRHYAWIR